MNIPRSGGGGDDDTHGDDLFWQVLGKYGLAWCLQ